MSYTTLVFKGSQVSTGVQVFINSRQIYHHRRSSRNGGVVICRHCRVSSMKHFCEIVLSQQSWEEHTHTSPRETAKGQYKPRWALQMSAVSLYREPRQPFWTSPNMLRGQTQLAYARIRTGVRICADAPIHKKESILLGSMFTNVEKHMTASNEGK